MLKSVINAVLWVFAKPEGTCWLILEQNDKISSSLFMIIVGIFFLKSNVIKVKTLQSAHTNNNRVCVCGGGIASRLSSLETQLHIRFEHLNMLNIYPH